MTSIAYNIGIFKERLYAMIEGTIKETCEIKNSWVESVSQAFQANLK